MGHPADYLEIDEENEFTSSDLEKVFTGHPKYSRRWLKKYKQKGQIPFALVLPKEKRLIFW